MARASIGRRPRRGSGLAAEPPPWRVVVDHNALKSLRRLSRPDRERIVRAIDQLPSGDVRPLQGEPGMWPLRVGGWRVRFRLDMERRRIDVTAVRARGGAYKP